MINETPITISSNDIDTDITRMFRRWTDGSKHLISHYLTPTEIRYKSKFTGTDKELLEWVARFPHKVGAIFVVSDHDIVYDMEKLRPELCFYKIVITDDDNSNIQK